MKALMCDHCGAITRTRAKDLHCPSCKVGVYREYSAEKVESKPISVESLFTKTADDRKIKVSEKTLN